MKFGKDSRFENVNLLAKFDSEKWKFYYLKDVEHQGIPVSAIGISNEGSVKFLRGFTPEDTVECDLVEKVSPETTS